MKGETVAGEEDVSVKVERALAFLEMWMVVDPDGSISTKVFRKETHTDKYLKFGSSHLLEHKRGFVRMLTNSANRLVSEDTELRKERKHFRKALQINGYPDLMLRDFDWLFNRPQRWRRMKKRKMRRVCQLPPQHQMLHQHQK